MLSDTTPELTVPLRLSLIPPSAPVVPLKLSLIPPSAPVVLALIDADPVGSVAPPLDDPVSLPLLLADADADAVPPPLSPQPASNKPQPAANAAIVLRDLEPTQTPSIRRISAMRRA